MIAATLVVLLLHFGGGGAFSFEKAFEPFLKQVIAEESRRERAKQLTRDADENVQQFRKEVTGALAERFRTLLAEYDATDAQYHAVFEAAALSRTAMQQRMLDIRFELTRIMTRDEWHSMHELIDRKAEENRPKAGEEE